MIFYGLIDKSDFIEDGPWFDEPDLEIWERNDTVCVVRRTDGGSLCGYVGIKINPDSAPGWTVSYLKSIRDKLNVHGGVTFESGDIDHIVQFEQIDPTVLEWIDSYFFFGFDCAHVADLCFLKKELFHLLGHNNEIYKDWKYACNQCEKLSDQLQEVITLG